jgi:uncharacterized protein DUF4236
VRPQTAGEDIPPVSTEHHALDDDLRRMGFRFYRRTHLAPGIGINLSRSGPSLTLGVRGAHVTVAARGVTKTVGLPGTGVYYTSRHGYHTGYHSARSDVPLDVNQQARANHRAELMIVIVLAMLVLVVLAAAL